VTSTRGDALGPVGGWLHACCYLAGELLALAERRGSLAELQATALVPLELELISRADKAVGRQGVSLYASRISRPCAVTAQITRTSMVITVSAQSG
jgi:hypothetical protein